MGHVLFIFLDGVGLGANDKEINPFTRADMPELTRVLDGRRLIRESVNHIPFQSERVTLLALDACLGISGLPQSATGQATLLSGKNVPACLGYHYGPKPDPATAAFLHRDTIFHHLHNAGYKAGLLNAYPPRYFDHIYSGRRMYSAIPLAVTQAGLRLKNNQDLKDGIALSADFTALGWQKQLGFSDMPTLDPAQAGRRLVELSRSYDLAFFEYWLSDYAGHSQDMRQACNLLETLDQVLGGLFAAWQDEEGLVLITSDHGNLEDLSTRKHTTNPVPALLVGPPTAREEFADGLMDLTGITPKILRQIGVI